MVTKNDVKSWMEHRIPKKEARLVDRFEQQDVWACANCDELYEDYNIVICPDKNVSRCECCGSREWKIIKMIRPVRRIIWTNKK